MSDIRVKIVNGRFVSCWPMPIAEPGDATWRQRVREWQPNLERRLLSFEDIPSPMNDYIRTAVDQGL